MRRLLPHPYMSAGLFVMWMLLNQSISPGPALVGVVFALLGGLIFAKLEPKQIRLKRLAPIPGLAGRILLDIARSNLDVARVILKNSPERRQGFVRIPLAIRSDSALAVLACVLTATPGTAWVDFNAESGILLIHVLDLSDEEMWVRIVKERYEQPLMEIFQ
ncbi:Na+/H+ antiporter subunit E [Acetobacteraceae bacterium H6797]|nr:Na+/H+ antiporter subunit E [Acetobacteraceae bacterium H6797]